MDLFILAAASLLLYLGAEWLVGGASRLAASLRVPELVVGLTVVAYGTSAPEAVVGIDAALRGHGEIAFGNIVGSNIANLGLILGAAALIRPVRVDGAVRRRELPALLVSTAVLPLLIVDGRVERWEAAALAMGAVGYTLWALRSARTAADVREAQRRAMVTAKAAETGGAPPARARTRAVMAVLVGFGALVVGGHLIVAAATSLARAWGVSDRVIALTIVAWGTSLPELATSVIAAVRGHSEIALGNVIGSNIFNVMFCLASAGALVPIAVSPAPLLVDIAALLCLTVIAAVFIRSERTIRRWEAALLLIGYAGFVGYLALAPPV